MRTNISSTQLIVRLSIYFGVLITAMVLLVGSNAAVLSYLPIGGADILQVADITVSETLSDVGTGESSGDKPERARLDVSANNIRHFILFLSAHLVATIIVMVPITWTYSASRFEAGPSKVFVQTLLVLPLCAATVVLLIQDSLALAFGLAALVAAVRFRIALAETIDGIYIFAAICVGLAAGIGYIGAAIVLAFFFCFTSAALWAMDYGWNPVDDARQKSKLAKLAAKADE